MYRSGNEVPSESKGNVILSHVWELFPTTYRLTGTPLIFMEVLGDTDVRDRY